MLNLVVYRSLPKCRYQYIFQVSRLYRCLGHTPLRPASKNQALGSLQKWHVGYRSLHPSRPAGDIREEVTVIGSDSTASAEAGLWRIPTFFDRYVFPELPDLISEEEYNTVVMKVNECMESSRRLFAIVSLSGHQFRVTDNDLVRVQGYIPADCGAKIRLEKVAMVGGAGFTLIGKPILKRNLVKVEAAVIEKTPGVDMIIKRFKRRRRYERTFKFNSIHSVLRINSIKAYPHLQ